LQWTWYWRRTGAVVVVLLVVPAAHGSVEHLHGEHRVAAVVEDKEVSETQVVVASESLPTTLEEHAAFAIEHHLHVPQPSPSSGLPHLHFSGLAAVEHARKLFREPL
jgi:hypothetical protein